MSTTVTAIVSFETNNSHVGTVAYDETVPYTTSVIEVSKDLFVCSTQMEIELPSPAIHADIIKALNIRFANPRTTRSSRSSTVRYVITGVSFVPTP